MELVGWGGHTHATTWPWNTRTDLALREMWPYKLEPLFSKGCCLRKKGIPSGQSFLKTCEVSWCKGTRNCLGGDWSKLFWNIVFPTSGGFSLLSTNSSAYFQMPKIHLTESLTHLGVKLNVKKLQAYKLKYTKAGVPRLGAKVPWGIPGNSKGHVR